MPADAPEDNIQEYVANRLQNIRNSAAMLFFGDLALAKKVERVIGETKYFITRYVMPGVVQRWKELNPDLTFFDCAFVLMTESPEQFRQMRMGLSHFTTDNVLIRTAIGKKWAYSYNHDYDASLMSSIIMRDIILPGGAIEFLSKDAWCEYKICYKGIEYRGDTMNSWWTTLKEFLIVFGSDYFQTAKLNEEIKSSETAINFLSNPANHKKELPSYITDFLNVVYTIGNFIPVPKTPADFNRKRNSNCKDYWDLTLLAICNYYYNEQNSDGWEKLLEESKDWLGARTARNWDAFVEKNFLQDFVNQNPDGDYGCPKELWEGRFKKGNVLPTSEEEFRSFFKNASAWIIARGTRIMIALEEKQQSKKNNGEDA